MLGNFPETQAELAELNQAAVYILFRCYDKITLVYVGKSNEIGKRLHEHIGDIIGGKGDLFNEDGDVWRAGGSALFFEYLQKRLNETVIRGVADARRTTFIYSLIPDRADREAIEATLISRLWEPDDDRWEPPPKLKLWNDRCSRSLVGNSIIQHDPSMLKPGLLTTYESSQLEKLFDACKAP
jgi:hypothetical protein